MGIPLRRVAGRLLAQFDADVLAMEREMARAEVAILKRRDTDLGWHLDEAQTAYQQRLGGSTSVSCQTAELLVREGVYGLVYIPDPTSTPCSRPRGQDLIRQYGL